VEDHVEHALMEHAVVVEHVHVPLLVHLTNHVVVMDVVAHVGPVQDPIRATILDLVFLLLATLLVVVNNVVVMDVQDHVEHVAEVKHAMQMGNVLQVEVVDLVDLAQQDVDQITYRNPLICLIHLIWDQVESVVAILVHLHVKFVLQLVEYTLLLIHTIMLHKQLIFRSLFDVEGINNKCIQHMNIMVLQQLV